MFLRGPRLFWAYLINNDYSSAVRISHARLYRVGSVNISTILFRFSSISSNSLRGQAVCSDLSARFFSPHEHLIWGNTRWQSLNYVGCEPSLRQFVDSAPLHLNFKCHAMLQVFCQRSTQAGWKRWTNNCWRGFTFADWFFCEISNLEMDWMTLRLFLPNLIEKNDKEIGAIIFLWNLKRNGTQWRVYSNFTNLFQF